MPNTEPIPAPDLDALEAAYNDVFQSVPSDVHIENLVSRLETEHLTLIAKSRADDAEIAALREVAEAARHFIDSPAPTIAWAGAVEAAGHEGPVSVLRAALANLDSKEA